MLTLIKKFLLLLVVLFPLKVQAVISPTSDFYVYDGANILSSETEKYIVSKSSKLYDYNGAQIVVVTIPSLDGMSLENYATILFNTWEIGNKEKNNGLLLLLSLEERKFRVEVGSGIEGILPDGKTGRYQDEYLIPYLKDNKWDEGIKNLYDVFYDELADIEDIEEYNDSLYHEDVIEMIITMLIFAFIIYIIIKSNSGPRGFYSYGGFASSSGFGSSSSRGFSGGGGHSSGGGSSRSF